MGIKITSKDVAEGVAYADGLSADELLRRIGSDCYEVEFFEDEESVPAYDSTIYKITVTIEPA